MGSIDVMPVTVACFYYLLVYFTAEHERKLLLSLQATAKRRHGQAVGMGDAGMQD